MILRFELFLFLYLKWIFYISNLLKAICIVLETFFHSCMLCCPVPVRTVSCRRTDYSGAARLLVSSLVSCRVYCRTHARARCGRDVNECTARALDNSRTSEPFSVWLGVSASQNSNSNFIGELGCRSQ